MKQFLQLIYILILLCIATTTYAQNKEIEAIATFEMAEEQFNAKNYIQALEYVNKTKTILGKPNSKILFLGIQILNELSKTDAQYLEDALNAILVFEKIADEEQFSEEKRIVIAKVKLDLDKRKEAYENKILLKKEYDKMIYRLAAEFPKTEITVGDFIASVPSTWVRPSWGNGWDSRVTDKDINKFIKWGKGELNTLNQNNTIEKFYLKELNTHAPGKDQVKEYEVRKRLKYHDKPKNNISRDLTIDEICEVLKITPQQWNDFTTGTKPFIKKEANAEGYRITLVPNEKKPDGEYKMFQIYIHGKTSNWSRSEELWIQVFENTL